MVQVGKRVWAAADGAGSRTGEHLAAAPATSTCRGESIRRNKITYSAVFLNLIELGDYEGEAEYQNFALIGAYGVRSLRTDY